MKYITFGDVGPNFEHHEILYVIHTSHFTSGIPVGSPSLHWLPGVQPGPLNKMFNLVVRPLAFHTDFIICTQGWIYVDQMISHIYILRVTCMISNHCPQRIKCFNRMYYSVIYLVTLSLKCSKHSIPYNKYTTYWEFHNS